MPGLCPRRRGDLDWLDRFDWLDPVSYSNEIIHGSIAIIAVTTIIVVVIIIIISRKKKHVAGQKRVQELVCSQSQNQPSESTAEAAASSSPSSPSSSSSSSCFLCFLFAFALGLLLFALVELAHSDRWSPITLSCDRWSPIIIMAGQLPGQGVSREEVGGG